VARIYKHVLIRFYCCFQSLIAILTNSSKVMIEGSNNNNFRQANCGGNMTINDNYKRLEAVENAYNKLASERSNWQSKYDINYQIMKMLSDYVLLSRLDMVGKRVLNIGCFRAH